RTCQWVRVDPKGCAFGNGAVCELLGLEPAANQDNTPTGDPLPKENTADLDADLLAVWPQNDEQRAELDGDRLFQELPAVESGTVYYADLASANAINSPAPIGLRWLRDELAPAVGRLACARAPRTACGETAGDRRGPGLPGPPDLRGRAASRPPGGGLPREGRRRGSAGAPRRNRGAEDRRGVALRAPGRRARMEAPSATRPHLPAAPAPQRAPVPLAAS